MFLEFINVQIYRIQNFLNIDWIKGKQQRGIINSKAFFKVGVKHKTLSVQKLLS